MSLQAIGRGRKLQYNAPPGLIGSIKPFAKRCTQGMNPDFRCVESVAVFVPKFLCCSSTGHTRKNFRKKENI